MEIKVNSFYYSNKDNNLVIVDGTGAGITSRRVHYKIVGNQDSESNSFWVSEGEFKNNFKRVAWIE